MLGRLKGFIVTHQNDILLTIGVILISLLSFAVGYIVAKQQMKKPIQIEYGYNDSLMHTNNADNILV